MWGGEREIDAVMHLVLIGSSLSGRLMISIVVLHERAGAGAQRGGDAVSRLGRV